MASQETYARFFPTHPYPAYTYGLSFPQSLARRLPDLAVRRPYILISATLSRQTDALQRTEHALADAGIRIAGVRKGMRPHTMYSEVLEMAEDIKRTGADAIVTVGGGSLVDGAKVAAFAIANDATTPTQLATKSDASFALFKQHGHSWPSSAPSSGITPSTLPIICAATTLSGGEFNALGGATDDATHHKHLMAPGSQVGPKLIILDAALTLTTPMRTWLGTGVRAMDHCIEALLSSSRTPESDSYAAKGLAMLIPALLQCKRDPAATAPRVAAYLAAVESMRMMWLKVPVGASHGIGHQLGPLGVAHGETSCVLMPSVQRYNKRVNGGRQEEVLSLLWEQEEVKDLLAKRKLKRGEADLGDVLDVVISELGMPRSLEVVGIGEDRFEEIAENSLTDWCCQTNPIPLTEKGQVVGILQMAR